MALRKKQINEGDIVSAEIHKKEESIDYSRLKFDMTGKDLRAYLSLVRKGSIPCQVCGTDSWGSAEHGFADGTFRALPDSVTPAEFQAITDVDERMAKCSPGKYNFICAKCGFVLGFNALVVAVRLAQKKDEDDKNVGA